MFLNPNYFPRIPTNFTQKQRTNGRIFFWLQDWISTSEWNRLLEEILQGSSKWTKGKCCSEKTEFVEGIYPKSLHQSAMLCLWNKFLATQAHSYARAFSSFVRYIHMISIYFQKWKVCWTELKSSKIYERGKIEKSKVLERGDKGWAATFVWSMKGNIFRKENRICWKE